MKYLVLISIVVLASCSPCKRIAKHPECFPSDTVVITNEVVHYEKEIVVNDSIIRDTAPCDPITNTYYKTNTVYKTNYKTIIDTIYQSKETTKINPLNEALKESNDKLNVKLLRSRKFVLWLSIILVVILLINGLYVYFKLK